jgi:hypothetical protein
VACEVVVLESAAASLTVLFEERDDQVDRAHCRAGALERETVPHATLIGEG